MMITRIFHKIRQLDRNRKLKKNKTCLISKGAYISLDSEIEGKNRFCSGSALFRSKIGRGSYINSKTELRNCVIGRYSSIGSNVKTISGRTGFKKNGLPWRRENIGMAVTRWLRTA